jgi:hypothetical protein
VKTCLPLSLLPPLSYLGPETFILGSLLFGRLNISLGPKLRPGWEAKFCFGVATGEPSGVRAGSVWVELSLASLYIYIYVYIYLYIYICIYLVARSQP